MDHSKIEKFDIPLLNFQFWNKDILKIQLWNFGNHRSFQTYKPYFKAQWYFLMH